MPSSLIEKGHIGAVVWDSNNCYICQIFVADAVSFQELVMRLQEDFQ